MKLKQWLAAAVSGVMVLGFGAVMPERVQEIAPVEDAINWVKSKQGVTIEYNDSDKIGLTG